MTNMAGRNHEPATTNDEQRVPSPSKERPEPWAYRKLAGPAEQVKAVIQMLIGLATVVLLGMRIYTHLSHGGSGAMLSHTTRAELFDIVGYSLAAAAAVELAYTLYTRGPDEAIDPVMLALSAALLLQLGQVETFHWSEGLAAVFYVAALGGLFWIRDKYVSGSKSTSPAQAADVVDVHVPYQQKAAPVAVEAPATETATDGAGHVDGKSVSAVAAVQQGGS